MDKEKAAKSLAAVPEQNVFWCHGGRVLRDMKELRDALVEISDDEFTYHSNDIKKDFSNWVRDVIGDEALAADLESATNREQAARVVEDRYTLLLNCIE
jgi:hypothetical protein